jgi:hypothetical protein
MYILKHFLTTNVEQARAKTRSIIQLLLGSDYLTLTLNVLMIVLEWTCNLILNILSINNLIDIGSSSWIAHSKRKRRDMKRTKMDAKEPVLRITLLEYDILETYL